MSRIRINQNYNKYGNSYDISPSDPRFWGPSLWSSLLSLAGSANSQEKRRHFRNLVDELGYLLPCSECAQNFSNHRKKLNIDDYMDSAESLVEWVYEIKKMADNNSKTPHQPPPPKQQVFKRYIPNYRIY